MRGYTAVLRARFLCLIQYRAAAAAGLATQVFWGLIRVMIFEAFYREAAPSSHPMALHSVVTYVWLGQAMLAMLPWNVDPDVRAMVRSGAVAYEMVRPLDLYGLWFARAVAMRTAPTLLRAVPLVGLALLFLGMRMPPTAGHAAAWAVAMAGALLLSCAITVLLGITLLWTISGEGIVRIAPAAIMLGSGLVVPLPFFPPLVRRVAEWLPFRGIADAPYRLYTGDLPTGALPGVLLHQAAWTVALVLVGRWVLARGVRRLVVQGG